jgi:hypothetical protein
MAQEPAQEPADERPGWLHSLSEGCRSVAQTLGLRKLQEIIQVRLHGGQEPAAPTPRRAAR